MSFGESCRLLEKDNEPRKDESFDDWIMRACCCARRSNRKKYEGRFERFIIFGIVFLCFREINYDGCEFQILC